MTRFTAVAVAVMTAVALGACRPPAPEEEAPEGWSLTAWGETFEIFAEVGPLVVGEPAVSHTHVTVLGDFSPLRQGSVSVVLRGPGAADELFRQDNKTRDGIYPIEIKPRREGELDLFFIVDAPSGREQISGGRVRVGGRAAPGGRLESGAARPAEEGVRFLKEQQWRTPFATAWAREGTMAITLHGPARVRPAGGGETVLTASMDAVVLPRPWPFRGQSLGAGVAVFQLTPQVTGMRSEAELDADVRALAADVETARSRSERLRKLVELEAVSQAELERAEGTRTSGEARLSAARRDLATARAARSGGGGGASFAVRAPWAAQVAEVSVSPGQAVSAGTPLARLVKPSPVWIEVALTPGDAARLRAGTPVQSLFLRRAGESAPVVVPGGSVRFISRAPEVDARTAAVTAIFEVRESAAEFPFGTAAEAEIALPGEQSAVIVPTGALVDDGGVTVAYVQLDGESFARREVSVALPAGRRRRPRRHPCGRAAGDAGQAGDPPGFAALHRRARRPRALRSGHAQRHHPRLAAPPRRRSRGRRRPSPRRRPGPPAPARGRLPRPHRPHRHRDHRGQGHGAGGGRDPRHRPGRVGPQRRARCAPPPLGVRPRASPSSGSSSSGARTSTAPGRSSPSACRASICRPGSSGRRWGRSARSWARSRSSR